MYLGTNTGLGSKGLWWRVILLVVFTITLPDFAFAQNDTPIGDVFCTVALWFTGNTSKGIATLSILITSMGAVLGKVTWGAVIIVGTGVSIMFGAGLIVDALIGAAPITCAANIANSNLFTVTSY